MIQDVLDALIQAESTDHRQSTFVRGRRRWALEEKRSNSGRDCDANPKEAGT